MAHPLRAWVESLQTLYPGQFDDITVRHHAKAYSLFSQFIQDKRPFAELRRAAAESEGLSQLFAEYEEGGLDEAAYAWLVDACHRYRLFPSGRQPLTTFHSLVVAFDMLHAHLPPVLRTHDIMLATNSTYHATAKTEFASPTSYAIVLSERFFAAAASLSAFYFDLFAMLRTRHNVGLPAVTAQLLDACLRKNPRLVDVFADLIAFTYFGEKYAAAISFGPGASDKLARQTKTAMMSFLLGHELYHVVEEEPPWAWRPDVPTSSEVIAVLREHGYDSRFNPDELSDIADQYVTRAREHMFEVAADAAAAFWVVKAYAGRNLDLDAAVTGSLLTLLLVKYIDIIDDARLQGGERGAMQAHPLLPDILLPKEHPRGAVRVLFASDYLYRLASDAGRPDMADHWVRLLAALEVPFEVAIDRAIALCKRVEQFPGEFFVMVDSSGNRHIHLYEDMRLSRK